MKQVLTKIFILTMLFLVVLGIMLYQDKLPKKEETATILESRLPVVEMIGCGVDGEGVKEGVTASGEPVTINTLYGYTEEMEQAYMRDCLTPIFSDRTVNILVDTRSNSIMGASFEIRSLDGSNLVENTKIDMSKATRENEVANIPIQIDNLIEKDREYLLVLKLQTDRFDSIYYYTRLILLTNNYCKEVVDFAKNFSDATMSEENAESIISYLEPNAAKDNTNLGDVNINSSFNQICWGSLKPEKMTDTKVSVKEVLDSVVCLELTYKVKAMNDYETAQFYSVKENYRIKWNPTEIYLLDYRREMNQLFDANNQNISTSRINLGIDPNLDCEYLASESGKFIVFARENGIWEMCIANNKVRPLLVFCDSASVDVRKMNDERDVRILSVDDKGNVEFIVYGYFNQGDHEGKVGLELYRYNYKDNIVKGHVFVPFTKPYQVLKETVGRLAHLTDNQLMYLMLQDSIFSVDLTGEEYVEVISGLTEESFAVNEKGDLLAWIPKENASDSAQIHILNLENGVENVIHAPENKKLKVIGFVNDDFAYGVADSNMDIVSADGQKVMHMNELRITNQAGEELKSYPLEGYFFTKAIVEGNMITLTRESFDAATNSFIAQPDYQIFGNEEKLDDYVKLSTITTDRKQVEVVLSFAVKVTSSNKLDVVYPEELDMSGVNELRIRPIKADGEKYYVYSYGKVVGIYTRAGDAVSKAYEENGVVVKNDGEMIWARISRPTQRTVANISMTQTAAEGDLAGQKALCLNSMLGANGISQDTTAEVQAGKSAVGILNSYLTGHSAYDLTGCSLSQVLYYIVGGQPLLGQVEGDRYLLVIGYDFYNALLMNPVTGTTYKMGIEETESMFRTYGNKFVGID